MSPSIGVRNGRIIKRFSTPKIAMRPSVDLAYRARNWFWYWRVRQLSCLSDAKLDAKAFGDCGRVRHFERVRKTASSPADFPLVNGQSLLSIVDQWDVQIGSMDGPYARATSGFESRLWEFLARNDLSPQVYTEFIQSFVHERGWLRIEHKDHDLYAFALGDEEPAVDAHLSTTYSAMLHRLVNDFTPDAIAVLIALFREAMSESNLDHAILVRKALKAAILLLEQEITMDRRVVKLIWSLVKDRVLSNRWITEADWREATDTPIRPRISTRARAVEFNAWVGWYISNDRRFKQSTAGLYPIVPTSERTDWLASNRHELSRTFEEVRSLRRTYLSLRDSQAPAQLQQAASALARAEALENTLQRPRSTRAMFYDQYPEHVLADLPPPFEKPGS